MKHRVISLTLGLLLAVPSLAEEPAGSPVQAVAKIEDFAWMAGHWRGDGLGGVCEEVWSESLGGSMIGLFRLVKDGKLVFSEHMTLVAEAGSIVLKVKHFTPEFVAWEDREQAVRFALEESRPGAARFQGLAMRRTGDGLEIDIRIRHKDGTTKDEPIRLKAVTRQPYPVQGQAQDRSLPARPERHPWSPSPTSCHLTRRHRPAQGCGSKRLLLPLSPVRAVE